MELKVFEWTVLFCMCAFGIQTSFSFIQNMREIQQNCFRDGGYCIHTIPPQPRRRNNRRRGGAAGGRMGTRTRKGSRPDPRALGQQHVRTPGSSQQAGGAPGYPPQGGQSAAYDPMAASGTQAPAQQNTGLFGTSANDPFNSFLSMMMFTRKKRQAGVPEPHERPRIRAGENMFNFLNRHCRKSEFDFGCRDKGGMCCIPFIH